MTFPYYIISNPIFEGNVKPYFLGKMSNPIFCGIGTWMRMTGPTTIALHVLHTDKLKNGYGKCPKNSNTKVSDKMTYANSADPDQTAPEGAV